MEVLMQNNAPKAHPLPENKFQVVYYLCRDGKMDQPHLLEGNFTVVTNELRLRDFKTYLASLRGKNMPNSFAWSYKRIYKNGFVWYDLDENDVIQPISSNEYVLMGSEINSDERQNQGSKMCNSCGCALVDKKATLAPPLVTNNEGTSNVLKGKVNKKRMTKSSECLDEKKNVAISKNMNTKQDEDGITLKSESPHMNITVKKKEMQTSRHCNKKKQVQEEGEETQLGLKPRTIDANSNYGPIINNDNIVKALSPTRVVSSMMTTPTIATTSTTTVGEQGDHEMVVRAYPKVKAQVRMLNGYDGYNNVNCGSTTGVISYVGDDEMLEQIDNAILAEELISKTKLYIHKRRSMKKKHSKPSHGIHDQHTNNGSYHINNSNNNKYISTHHDNNHDIIDTNICYDNMINHNNNSSHDNTNHGIVEHNYMSSDQSCIINHASNNHNISSSAGNNYSNYGIINHSHNSKSDHIITQGIINKINNRSDQCNINHGFISNYNYIRPVNIMLEVGTSPPPSFEITDNNSNNFRHSSASSSKLSNCQKPAAANNTNYYPKSPSPLKASTLHQKCKSDHLAMASLLAEIHNPNPSPNYGQSNRSTSAPNSRSADLNSPAHINLWKHLLGCCRRVGQDVDVQRSAASCHGTPATATLLHEHTPSSMSISSCSNLSSFY